MEYIAPNIRQLDTLLAGKSHISASFLIEGEEPALVEAGAQSSASTVIDALRSVGVGPEDLRYEYTNSISYKKCASREIEYCQMMFCMPW